MAATFAGWLEATDRSEVILWEGDPSLTLMGFTVVGGAHPTTYEVALPRSVERDLIAGGIYCRCVGVQEDATALTAQASLNDVEANAGSYWWDEANETLYVHTTTGDDPSTFTLLQAAMRFYMSNAPIVLELDHGDPSTAVYYMPWMTSDVPRILRQADDLLSGAMVIPSGDVSFTNGHQAWFALVAPDGLWNWKNKPVRFFMGGRYAGGTLTRDQYAAMATMLVSDAAPDEQRCTFQLLPTTRAADLDLPVTPFFPDAYPNLGDGVQGTRKWIGYGRTTMRPDLTDTSTHGVYTVADAAYQTLFAVHSVWAIDKTTGVWTPLTLTTDYTVDLTACTVTIVNASYAFEDYEIAVDVTGKPDGLGGAINTYAAIVEDVLLALLRVPAANLDAAAFTVAKAEADAELSFWIKSPRTFMSLLSTSETGFASLGRSVMGTVQQTIEGLWTIRIWNPDVDAITTSLTRRHFASFRPKPKLKTTYSRVVVYYNYDHARAQWTPYEVTDAATRYRTDSVDELPIYTFLREESNARSIAQRYQLLAGAVTIEAAFQERGSLLAQHEGGGKAFVTYAPAPTPTRAFNEQAFEVLLVEVTMAPKLNVAGVLGNLRGLGGRIGRWMGSSAPDWATATPAARRASGFWNSSNGLADPSDPSSAGVSLWW